MYIHIQTYVSTPSEETSLTPSFICDIYHQVGSNGEAEMRSKLKEQREWCSISVICVYWKQKNKQVCHI